MNAIPRSLILYVVVTFALTAAYGFALPLLGIPQSSPLHLVLGVAYMFIPALVAVVFQRRAKGRVRDLGVSWKVNVFWLAAWLGPAALALLGIAVSLLMPGAEFSPGIDALLERFAGIIPEEQLPAVREQFEKLPVHPFWVSLPQALVAGATINAVAAFGEELGWRGYMQQQLAHLGFWKANTLIGVIWGLWHAPMILQGHNYPDAPVAGVAMMTVACVPLSLLFGWVRVRGGSVIAASIAHGSFNAVASLGTLVIAGGSALTTGPMGLGLTITATLLCLAIAIFDRNIDVASSPAPQAKDHAAGFSP